MVEVVVGDGVDRRTFVFDDKGAANQFIREAGGNVLHETRITRIAVAGDVAKATEKFQQF